MNPPEPGPAPSETTRRRKTMEVIRRVGLTTEMSPPVQSEPQSGDAEPRQETSEAAQQPASAISPKPLRVARSPHPLDNFSFDQLCPADDDELTQGTDKEETLAADSTAKRQKDWPKGPFKGPTNKVAAPPRERKSERYVPKTMLDHNLILQNLSVSVAKSNEKLAQKVAEKEAEPPKPCIPIEKYKMAQKTCPFTWGEMDAPKERFRYCDKCETPVYNFTGMDLPEAEELIFKREERRNAPLFKRADGKFMTKDCPVALKKKNGMVMMIAGGILVLVIIAVLVMLNPAPPPKPAEAPSTNTLPEDPTNPSQSQPSTTQPGSDQGGVVVPPVTQPVAPPVEPPIQLPNRNQTPGSAGPGA